MVKTVQFMSLNNMKEDKKPGRILDYDKKLPVLEIYTCIQSEGSRQGRPTVAIRTTGCTHRCWFGEGGWCDSWYTSIHPEKGIYTFNDIIKIYDENEIPLAIDDVTNDKELISILEIQGIKFTARNFQIELEVRQSVTVSPDPFLETCFIKIPNKLNKQNNKYDITDRDNHLFNWKHRMTNHGGNCKKYKTIDKTFFT